VRAHFSDEDWLDFVRAIIYPEKNTVLEQHLHNGCPQCLESLAFWEHVREVARNETRNDVPEEVVEAGIEMFGPWRRTVVMPRQARRAWPTFDSLWEPLPVGIRGAVQPPRRLIHRLGRWLIELSIQWESSNRVAIVGRVLKPGWTPREGLQVLLMNGDELLAETDANRFGEFQFNVDRAPNMAVFFELPKEAAIAVELPNPDQPVQRNKSSSGPA
jgi:hypothetical protein